MQGVVADSEGDYGTALHRYAKGLQSLGTYIAGSLDIDLIVTCRNSWSCGCR